jgi:alpha-beta hydrolase superfamily lysophospholipase
MTGLKYKTWLAPSPRGALVLVHGMGAGTERWESLAEYFRSREISSYAVSLRGFDGTEGEKGYVDSFETYHSDIKTLHEKARKDVPEGKIFLLGESMGALIAFDHTALGSASFDGYILISPAFGSKLKFAPHTYLFILLSMLLFPRKQFKMPFNAKMCTSDSEEVEKIEHDPAEHRYATGRLLWEIFKRQIGAKRLAKRINSPVLFLLSEDDEIADPARSEKVFSFVPGAKAIGKVSRTYASKCPRGEGLGTCTFGTCPQTLKKYPGMKHALSVEAGREEVFRDIYEWGWGEGD